MKQFLFLYSIFIFLTQSAFAINSGEFAIEHEPRREVISYKIPVHEEFKNYFINSLKTGDVVSVSHKVKIRPVNKWFGWLAEKNYTKYYKYNLITNQYYVGVKKDQLKPVPSIDYISKNLATLINAPFLPKNVLKKGHAYEIDFTITINHSAEKDVNKLLPFKGDVLKESIHGAVHYIDK